ncbi:hypothetical protein LTR15_005579 [Elasticomyces elasticus]|nr:hypothetical protein LTR15_005579 [Elasticomyces elasticus]
MPDREHYDAFTAQHLKTLLRDRGIVKLPSRKEDMMDALVAWDAAHPLALEAAPTVSSRPPTNPLYDYATALFFAGVIFVGFRFGIPWDDISSESRLFWKFMACIAVTVYCVWAVAVMFDRATTTR